MIWLMRHAEAEDGSPDAERRLTRNGEEQARAAGAALVRLGVELDGCAASPKLRARETARLVCEAMGIDLVEDERLAAGPFDPDEVAAEVGEHVLLVGHDPDFSMALHRMTGAQARLPKSGIAAVDRGELKVLLRPQELGALAQAPA